MARMTEQDLRGPTLCEGWTRAHVLAHLARNADALQHLVQWAASGREKPAYASPDQRNREIEESATQSLPRLRADVISASNAFRNRVEALRGRTDLSPVTFGSGVTLPGDRVPWARLREVTVHHVDLDLGFDYSDVPSEVVRAGLVEAVGRLSRAASQPLTLKGTDGRHWNLNGGGTTGQAGAVKLGLARALVKAMPEAESTLRDQGLLTRDARKVERKKYGRRGARRSFQFSKR